MIKFSKFEFIRLTINRLIIVIILTMMLFYFCKSILIQIYNLLPIEADLSENNFNEIKLNNDSDFISKGSNFYNYSTLMPNGCYQKNLRYIFYTNLNYYKDVSAGNESNGKNSYSRNLSLLDSKYMIFQTNSGKKIIVRVNKNWNKSKLYAGVIRSFPFRLLIAIKENSNTEDYPLIEKQYYFDTKIIYSFTNFGGIFINSLISILLIMLIIKTSLKYANKKTYPLYRSILQYNDTMNLDEKISLLNIEMNNYKKWKFKLLKKIYTDKLVVERGIINTKVSNK
jgi:hypothetical protein